MFNDNKVNPKIKDVVEGLMNDVRVLTPELSKGSINYDHGSIKSHIETALMFGILCEIRDELRALNHYERMRRLPQSMLNPDVI
jgi:hypothetical protein